MPYYIATLWVEAKDEPGMSKPQVVRGYAPTAHDFKFMQTSRARERALSPPALVHVGPIGLSKRQGA